MEINNHEDVRYSCDQCDFKSKWTQSLKRHLDSVHGDVRYTCEQCDYKATQTHSLKRHIVSVHGDVWHSCGQCDYKTKWNNNLKIHIDSVRGDMQYSCERKNRMVSSHMFMEVYGTERISQKTYRLHAWRFAVQL